MQATGCGMAHGRPVYMPCFGLQQMCACSCLWTVLFGLVSSVLLSFELCVAVLCCGMCYVLVAPRPLIACSYLHCITLHAAIE